MPRECNHVGLGSKYCKMCRTCGHGVIWGVDPLTYSISRLTHIIKLGNKILLMTHETKNN